MAKKKRAKYTSKGQRPVIAKENHHKPTATDRFFRQWEAYMNGRNVVLTIANPNPLATRSRFIKVNAKEYWGDHRKREWVIQK